MAIFYELPILESQPDLPRPQARPMSPSQAAQVLALKKPEWLKIRPPAGDSYYKIKSLMKERQLNTVCEEAHCPNLSECWASGTATFMLGGDTCTRACRFCAVKTARIPPPLDPKEPAQIAASIATLGLHYVVLTSVDRDDLPDGGAGHFAETVREIKRLNSEILVEALVPDFRGNIRDVHTIVESGLDVYAHNIETVERLQYRVRDPRANYQQSLATLCEAKAFARSKGKTLHTKSSIMLGLGEEYRELEKAFSDLRSNEVDVLTLGQYLRPSPQHLPVERFLTPDEFDQLAARARAGGFIYVASGPMVRSSYRAGELFIRGLIQGGKKNHAI